MDDGVEEAVALDDDPLLLDDDDAEPVSVGAEGVSIVRDDDCVAPGALPADPEIAELQPTTTSNAATAPASAPRLITRR